MQAGVSQSFPRRNSHPKRIVPLKIMHTESVDCMGWTERLSVEKHGDEYQQYQKDVPMFWPILFGKEANARDNSELARGSAQNLKKV